MEVEIFDWPDTFFVEAQEIDRDYVKFFPEADREIPPYLVDLSEPPQGVCDCRDFRFNVAPFLKEPGHRKTCSHIIAATRFKNLLGQKPTKLPPIINI